MITKTFTYVSFFFNENDFEFQKKFDDELAYFSESQLDVPLEEYLRNLLALKSIIKKNKVERIAIFHTLFYDAQCNTEFSPMVMELIQKLGATFCFSTQRVGEANLYAVLDKMRERPAMYLGEATLSALSHFISGFYEGCNYESNEQPTFDGFNDFVGNYYGKYTTAGWKNLILADHYGNESEAIRQFYVLLDEFRLEENRPSARSIVFKLMQLSYIDFRAESHILMEGILQKSDISEAGIRELKKQLSKINHISNMLHNVPFELRSAVISNKSFHYDEILSNIFDKANTNKGLFELIKSNVPKVDLYIYELWEGIENENKITTVIKRNHLEKDKVLESVEKPVKTFFAINDEKAKAIKDGFMTSSL